MGKDNFFTNTFDAVWGTDVSGQKKKAKREQRKMEQALQNQQAEEKKKQEKEKKKQQDSSKQFYESMRQGSLGLLKPKDKQSIG